MKRRILVVISDTHGGHTLGLMNPNVVLYEENEDGSLTEYVPRLTSVQEYLWSLYLSNIKSVVEWADGDEIVLIHNGDLTHGLRFPVQIVSSRMADQVLIAKANLEPWYLLPNLKKVRLTEGTGVHVFGEGSSELIVGMALREKFASVDTKVFSHGLGNIDGLEVDYAHHGPPPGTRAWLSGNEARYYLRSLMMRHIMDGKTPPRLVLRSHYHNYVRETVVIPHGDEDIESTLVVTPSYSTINEHAKKSTKSEYKVTNGLVAIEVVDGQLSRVKRYTKTKDVRTKETL